MLISHPPLDSTFSNPVDSRLLPYSSIDDSSCYPPGEQGWSPSTQSQDRTTLPDDFASSQDHPPPHERLHQSETVEDGDFRTADPSKDFRTPVPQEADPEDRLPPSVEGLLLNQLRDFCLQQDKQQQNQEKLRQNLDKHRRKLKEAGPNKLLPSEDMSAVDPEDDLRCLVENDRQLELCGYYYGSLSWLDASHLLRQCRVGTFLVRDSEHGSYLYTLSVQTRKGPTSCRIEYAGGHFRLDSSKDLLHKMPRFDSVISLVDFYVRLPRYLPPKNCNKAVWLDMDEENTLDVPVQIYRPLYRQARSLQHMCRVAVARAVDDMWGGDLLQGSVLPCKPFRTDPANTLQKALERDAQYKQLPTIIKEYLSQYPYSQ